MDSLYDKDLLRQAAKATGAGKLAAPQATLMLDNPLCGDRITVELSFDGDGPERRVREIGHTVKGCVLCQASASIIGQNAKGATAASLKAQQEHLSHMLKKQGPLPATAWPALAAFEPVADHKSRHNCVLLPFEAVIEAALS